MSRTLSGMFFARAFFLIGREGGRQIRKIQEKKGSLEKKDKNYKSGQNPFEPPPPPSTGSGLIVECFLRLDLGILREPL